MKYKNVNLEWNVLYIEPNSKQIKKFNIFNEEFKDALCKQIKNKKLLTYDDIYNYFDRYAHYYYWQRAECEMLIGDLFSKSIDNFYKIDIYDQIEINMTNIISYLINALKIDFDKNKNIKLDNK